MPARVRGGGGDAWRVCATVRRPGRSGAPAGTPPNPSKQGKQHSPAHPRPGQASPPPPGSSPAQGQPTPPQKHPSNSPATALLSPLLPAPAHLAPRLLQPRQRLAALHAGVIQPPLQLGGRRLRFAQRPLGRLAAGGGGLRLALHLQDLRRHAGAG